MANDETQRAIAALTKFVTPARLERMNRVLSYRTRWLTVALEEIYQPHNASAVLRSCDAFGIQDVHIMQNKNEFVPNKEIALGSSKWLTLHNRAGESAPQVYDSLRAKGYKIVATALKDDATTLHNLNVAEQPTALVFGSELNGLTKEAIASADEVMYIPMYGFVESFNISVSVAIALSYLVDAVRSSGAAWRLKETEAQDVLLAWLREDVHRADEIEHKIAQKIEK